MRVSSNSKLTLEEAKVFGTETRRLRKDAGIKVKELAELVGISYTHMSNIENPNKNKKPSPQLAERIASVFDTTVDEMLSPHSENDYDEWCEYGKNLMRHRAAKGLATAEVARALGIGIEAYRAYEFGKGCPPDRIKERLNSLLDVDKPIEKPTEQPKAIEPAEESVEVKVSDATTDICDIILAHVKALKVDTNTQKKVWRFFIDMKIDAEERRLFG